jgi:hypothetical protein
VEDGHAKVRRKRSPIKGLSKGTQAWLDMQQVIKRGQWARGLIIQAARDQAWAVEVARDQAWAVEVARDI